MSGIPFTKMHGIGNDYVYVDDLAGRPVLIQGNSQLMFRGMKRLSEASVINTKNKSHAVTAQVVVPDGGGQGALEDLVDVLPHVAACLTIIGLDHHEVAPFDIRESLGLSSLSSWELRRHHGAARSYEEQ